MPRYEFRCFLTVEADNLAEADKIAGECCDEFSTEEWSFSLDDSPADEVPEEEYA